MNVLVFCGSLFIAASVPHGFFETFALLMAGQYLRSAIADLKSLWKERSR